jgi:cold shock CspA family protein
MQGTVVRYDRTKGFGFITPADPSLPDFFVHVSDVVAANKHLRFLVVGQPVEFDPTAIDTKPKATNVRRLPMTVARQVSEAVAAAEAKAGDGVK